ncbi:dinucleotide-utilizing enzyme [Microbacterium sp. zg-Y625]|uniref:dinucleotide-utilizing enzyme n=1 Tax=Microbacterium jiangjiandongii TaxID=3049071 RepID=UPI00254FE72D|nr:dinucleotide-utilizing enzyme [Microbacterium sp. zg-Y625]WIM26528.1 dinucleotide-utilizing enzyme [Microbacterium sp. zg-Y625]
MTSRARLARSIPFWILVVGSLATAIAGAVMLFDRLTVMATALAAGTATGIEVYVGQVEAVVGGILVGAGLVGLALALTVASARSLVPAASAAVPAPEPFDGPAVHSTSATASPASTAGSGPAPAGGPAAHVTTVDAAGPAPALTKPRVDASDPEAPRP